MSRRLADKDKAMAPPFRAEHIGSLLRPAALLDMRARYLRGEIDFARLQAATSVAIEEAIALQERVGLQLATDGEFRREAYHSYFFRQLGDISLDASPAADGHGASGRGAQPQATIDSRLAWKKPIHVQDFEFLKARTKLTPKITIPGPCALHFRGGDHAVLATAYSDVDAFWEDIVAAYQAELRALADAGCTYVQIDETAFAKFGDPDVQAALAARGDDWGRLIDFYIDVTNRVLRGLPASLTIGMHLCRGNRGGKWHAEGSYETVADRLFNRLEIRTFFLEYDSPRAGTFTPLRLAPKDKTIVLGLVSTKTSDLEDKDALKRRIDEATQFVALDKLGISPQCGFASVETGNPISPEAQEAKLRRVVEVAREVWG
jgi:5-methyltetrahydropteroyltriglutamate--homocysteine methyltransferase